MEMLTIKFNETEQFDSMLKSSLPDDGQLHLITKDNGTAEGNPIAMLTFRVQLPDGSLAQVQTVTTVRLLQMALAGLRGRYGDLA